MRPGKLSVAAALILAACSPRGEKVYRDTLDFGPGLLVPYGRLHPRNPGHDSLSVALFSPYLKAMGEPALDPARISEELYRVTYQPSFQPTATFRLVHRKEGCTMVRKQVRVAPGEEGPIEPWKRPMTLLHADSIPVSPETCTALIATFDSLRLRTEPEDVYTVGPDGHGFTFEQLAGRRYAAREVWEPDSAAKTRRLLVASQAFLAAAGYSNNAFDSRK